jgi:DNA-binding MarR family transcriptional regulator
MGHCIAVNLNDARSQATRALECGNFVPYQGHGAHGMAAGITSPAKHKTTPAATAEAPRLDDQLCFPLYAAARMMVNAYRPLLAELGLTYPQYLALLVLWETDGLSVSAIGERLYLDSGTLTPLLKRLESQGIITRRRSREDDRVVGNWLTESGRALARQAVGIPERLLCDANMAEHEVAPAKAILERLVAALLPLQPDAER